MYTEGKSKEGSSVNKQAIYTVLK